MSGFELLSDQGLRLDGRKASELRRIRCRMGVYGQADGSAYLEQGNTKVVRDWKAPRNVNWEKLSQVLAAVYGPHDMRESRLRPQQDKGTVNCQYSMAVFRWPKCFQNLELSKYQN